MRIMKLRLKWTFEFNYDLTLDALYSLQYMYGTLHQIVAQKSTSILTAWNLGNIRLE